MEGDLRLRRTFSPNAACMDASGSWGRAYTLWLAWKTNKPGAGSGLSSPQRIGVSHRPG
jgi:hypothetical protein